jgi:predicted RNase H-like nuclease
MKAAIVDERPFLRFYQVCCLQREKEHGLVPRAARIEMTVRLAGIDGRASGWVVATDDGVRVTPSLAAITDERFDLVAIDMPIGLPDAWGRAADQIARAYISPRGSCVFPTPPRALVTFPDYTSANRASKEIFGRGLSKQTFNLFPKLREVDALVEVADQERFIEAHPECCFRALTGAVMVSKHTRTGRDARRQALESVFGPLDIRLKGAAEDDVLDAIVLLWTATRHARGESLVFGGDEKDGRGLTMRIVV